LITTSDRSLAIVIPTWNNLPYLRLCVESIRRHSAQPHEIVAHVNEGVDGTRDWLTKEGIAFTESPENIGICRAVNRAAARSTAPLICLLNDDMYCLPGWDAALLERIATLGSRMFMLSGTMIEPVGTGNPCVARADFGTSIETFREAELLERFRALRIPDWWGSCWCPFVLRRADWNQVGGLSEEFSPGMNCENDLAMKLWSAGCRVFLGVGASMVYHFQRKSTGRVQRNPGSRQFLSKWGVSSSFLDRHYLRKGFRAESTELPAPRRTPAYFYDLARSKVKLAARRLAGG
jgi:GT2 family glycosyltransferase